MAYFTLGEMEMLEEDFEKAVGDYKLALEHYLGSLAERGNYTYHLGEALYRKGDKEKGVRVMLKGVEEIKRGVDKVDSFLVNVWLSGGYMRLADCLAEDEKKGQRVFGRKREKLRKGMRDW